MSDRDEADRKRDVSRRNILLASTTLAAATVLSTTAPVETVQAQQPAALPSGKKPNILVIFGDDIGQMRTLAPILSV